MGSHGIRDQVAIVGMGCTAFGEHWDKSTDDLLVESATAASASAGVSLDDIDAFWLGTMGSGVSGLTLSRPLRLVGKPVTRLENMCATGSESLRNACYAVASGAYDCAMAIGVEKLKDSGYSGLAGSNAPGAGDDGKGDTTAPANFSLLAPAYAAKYGVDPAELKDVLTRIAWKNHQNGAKNPRAQFRKEVSKERISRSPLVAGMRPPMTKPTLPDWVSMVGLAQGTAAPAVVTAAQTWSGNRLLTHAGGAARWLSEAGLPEGVPVPALLEASPEALALVLAGAATRRPIAPLGPRLTARELAGCIERLAAPCLLTQPPFADMAAAVAADLGLKVLTLDELPGPVCGVEPLPVPSPGDTAVVLHTSGTTGHPKAVPYRHDRLARRCRLNASLQQLRRGSVFATASPFHHIAGLGNIMVALAAGASIVAVPRFTVAAWRELEPLGVTHALAVPTMVEMLLRQGALPLRTLEVMQYGASPIHPDTLRTAMGQLPGADFLTLYGQTEGSPITWLSPEDHRLAAAGREELLASVGRAAPGVEVRLEDSGGSGPAR